MADAFNEKEIDNLINSKNQDEKIQLIEKLITKHKDNLAALKVIVEKICESTIKKRTKRYLCEEVVRRSPIFSITCATDPEYYNTLLQNSTTFNAAIQAKHFYCKQEYYWNASGNGQNCGFHSLMANLLKLENNEIEQYVNNLSYKENFEILRKNFLAEHKIADNNGVPTFMDLINATKTLANPLEQQILWGQPLRNTYNELKDPKDRILPDDVAIFSNELWLLKDKLGAHNTGPILQAANLEVPSRHIVANAGTDTKTNQACLVCSVYEHDKNIGEGVIAIEELPELAQILQITPLDYVALNKLAPKIEQILRSKEIIKCWPCDTQNVGNHFIPDWSIEEMQAYKEKITNPVNSDTASKQFKQLLDKQQQQQPPAALQQQSALVSEPIQSKTTVKQKKKVTFAEKNEIYEIPTRDMVAKEIEIEASADQVTEKSVQPVTDIHDDIIKCMQALGYKPDKAGVCRGIAVMAGQATLAGELVAFNTRLQFIQDHKQQLLKSNGNLNIKELNCSTAEAYNLIAFFDGIILAAQPHEHKDLFNYEINQLQVEKIFEVIKSEKVSAEGALTKLYSFVGQYDNTEALEKYLASLGATIEAQNQGLTTAAPIMIILSSPDHAINISYTPQNTPPWKLIDANHLENANTFLTPNELAEQIEKSFKTSRDECVLFATTIYATATNNNSINKAAYQTLQQQHNTEQLESIQPQTPAKKMATKTLYDLVITKGNKEQVKNLYKNQTLLTKQSEDGDTPLHIAALNGNVEAVQALIDADTTANKASLTTQNKNGYIPLHLTAFNGNVEAVQALIDADTTANKASLTTQNKNGYIPLHLTAFNGNVEAVQALIDADTTANKASLTTQDKGGYTPLHIANFTNNTEAIKLLTAALPPAHNISQQNNNQYALTSSKGNNCAFHCIIATLLSLPPAELARLIANEKYKTNFEDLCKKFAAYYNINASLSFTDLIAITKQTFSHPYDPTGIMGQVLREYSSDNKLGLKDNKNTYDTDNNNLIVSDTLKRVANKFGISPEIDVYDGNSKFIYSTTLEPALLPMQTRWQNNHYSVVFTPEQNLTHNESINTPGSSKTLIDDIASLKIIAGPLIKANIQELTIEPQTQVEQQPEQQQQQQQSTTNLKSALAREPIQGKTTVKQKKKETDIEASADQVTEESVQQVQLEEHTVVEHKPVEQLQEEHSSDAAITNTNPKEQKPLDNAVTPTNLSIHAFSLNHPTLTTPNWEQLKNELLKDNNAKKINFIEEKEHKLFAHVDNQVVTIEHSVTHDEIIISTNKPNASLEAITAMTDMALVVAANTNITSNDTPLFIEITGGSCNEIKLAFDNLHNKPNVNLCISSKIMSMLENIANANETPEAENVRLLLQQYTEYTAEKNKSHNPSIFDSIYGNEKTNTPSALIQTNNPLMIFSDPNQNYYTNIQPQPVIQNDTLKNATPSPNK